MLHATPAFGAVVGHPASGVPQTQKGGGGPHGPGHDVQPHCVPSGYAQRAPSTWQTA